MIKSFACKETSKKWKGKYSKKFPSEIQNRALRKLRQLDAAITEEDLRNPPGNKLENLKGDREGYMSIRINKRWRICFKWQNGEALDVRVVDYF